MCYNLPVLWFCCHQVSAQGDDWVSSTLERIEIPLCGVLNPHDGAAAPFELVITAGSELRNAIGLLDLARDQFGVNDPRRTALSALSEIFEQVEESEYESANFPMEQERPQTYPIGLHHGPRGPDA